MDPIQLQPSVTIIKPDGAQRVFPNGEQWVFPLTKARITIGRFEPPANDIDLQPDPHQYVTREMHCYLEHQGTKWFVVSTGKNPTLLSQGQGASLCLVQGQALLADGDRICIQGGFLRPASRCFLKFSSVTREEQSRLT